MLLVKFLYWAQATPLATMTASDTPAITAREATSARRRRAAEAPGRAVLGLPAGGSGP